MCLIYCAYLCLPVHVHACLICFLFNMFVCIIVIMMASYFSVFPYSAVVILVSPSCHSIFHCRCFYVHCFAVCRRVQFVRFFMHLSNVCHWIHVSLHFPFIAVASTDAVFPTLVVCRPSVDVSGAAHSHLFVYGISYFHSFHFLDSFWLFAILVFSGCCRFQWPSSLPVEYSSLFVEHFRIHCKVFQPGVDLWHAEFISFSWPTNLDAEFNIFSFSFQSFTFFFPLQSIFFQVFFVLIFKFSVVHISSSSQSVWISVFVSISSFFNFPGSSTLIGVFFQVFSIFEFFWLHFSPQSRGNKGSYFRSPGSSFLFGVYK